MVKDHLLIYMVKVNLTGCSLHWKCQVSFPFDWVIFIRTIQYSYVVSRVGAFALPCVDLLPLDNFSGGRTLNPPLLCHLPSPPK